MKLNTKTKFTEQTHEGAPAARINAEQQLRRSVMSCLLWEDSYYEDGQSIADRIAALVPEVRPEAVAAMAVEAREKMKLRHVPLLLCREMSKHEKSRSLVSETLARVIQRPDELCEFLTIYSQGREGKKVLNKLAAQVRKGLAATFVKFNEHSLAKYNQQNAIKLRDVLFLTHPKPKDDEQAAVWKRLIDGTLATPDTWEVEISASKDKTASWTRLLSENKLGGLALLRNLRNFSEAKVDESVIVKALREMKTDRVLPFRFITAAKYAPQLESELEQAMFRCLESQEKLLGHTTLLVDISGSMFSGGSVSKHSELTRADAAVGLAMLLREVCEKVTIVAFSDSSALVPSRRGFALRDAIINSMDHGGTNLGAAINTANGGINHDRLIVLTDEQSADKLPVIKCKSYCINVASEKNGICYGAWHHIDGWSEAVVSYITALESEQSE